MKNFITPFLNRLLHFQRESGRDRQRAEEGGGGLENVSDNDQNSCK